ncbi:MAG: amidohydrolase [Gammaproteobacteria bacterium]|nr:amidohydrolase [Gammaproteobacteria bacterium]
MRAIDVHAHPSTQPMEETLRPFREAMLKYYRVTTPVRTEEEMAEDFRALDIKTILVAIDAETATGAPACTNDYVASLVRRFPDTFIGAFGSVDPWKGKMAVAEAERCINDLGLMGLKFAPSMQAFYPNDRRFYPLWETISGLGVPIQLHTGTTGLGAGMPGGAGIRLDYCRPIPYIDDLAADFPQLTIIACHPSWPFQDEMLAVLLHKGNVYNELSGWMPKYFPESLAREINGRLQDKFMFGSDYPALSPDRWLREFEQRYKPEVVEKVFRDNAIRILDLHIE